MSGNEYPQESPIKIPKELRCRKQCDGGARWSLPGHLKATVDRSSLVGTGAGIGIGNGIGA